MRLGVQEEYTDKHPKGKNNTKSKEKKRKEREYSNETNN